MILNIKKTFLKSHYYYKCAFIIEKNDNICKNSIIRLIFYVLFFYLEKKYILVN